MSDNPPATPPVPGQDPSRPPAAPPPYLGQGDGSFTPEQMERMANALAKHWTGSQEELRQRLAQDGIELVQPAEPPPADPDDAAIERVFGAPADGREYDLSGLTIGHVFPGADGASPIEVRVATDQVLRGVMAELGIPKSLGRGFAENILDAARAWDALPETGAALYSQEQISTAVQVTHAPSREATMDVIRSVVQKLAQAEPEATQALVEAGAFESAPVLAQLYMQGKRAVARGRR